MLGGVVMKSTRQRVLGEPTAKTSGKGSVMPVSVGCAPE